MVRLEIAFNKPPAHVYHPGSTVAGFVILHSINNEEIRDLSIHFHGFSRIIYAANADSIGRTGLKSSEDTVNYFSNHQILFQGPDFPPEVFKPNKVHQWPFEFTLVESTVQDLTASRVITREEVFETKPHQLPPSLHFEEGTISGGNYYELEAKLTRPTGKGASISQRQNVLFNQYSDALASLENVYRYPRGLLGRGGKEMQPVKLIEHRAVSFLAILPSSAASIRDARSASLPFPTPQPRREPTRRSSIFSSSSSSPISPSPSLTNRLRCTVDVAMPKILPLKKLFPISVTVMHGTTDSAPELFIDTVKLYLIMLTHWRVPNPTLLRPKAAYIRVTRQSKLLASKSDLDVSLKADTITELGPILKVRLEEATPLPFKSYCITRDYSVGIHLVVKTGTGNPDFVSNQEMPVKLANKLEGSDGNETNDEAGAIWITEPEVYADGSLI